MKEIKKPKEHRYPLRIYYDDTDAAGVVYHANYVRFMERARSELMIQGGLAANPLLADPPLFTVSNLEVAYLKPARLYDLIEVVSKVAQMSKVSIIFEHTIRSVDDPKLIFCIGKVKVVSVNDQMKPLRINPQLVEKICYDT